jgi:Peptidase family M48
LEAVVAQEIAHIANRDIRLMAASNVLMDIVLQLRRRFVLRIGGWKRGLLAVFFTPYLLAAMASGFAANVGLIVARLSRLLIATSREFVADAEAVRLTQRPEALISALLKIDGRSTLAGLDAQADAMMIDGAAVGAFATHPTIAERVATLARLSTITIDKPMMAAPAAPDVAVAGKLDIALWRQHLAQQALREPAARIAPNPGGRLLALAQTDFKLPAFAKAPVNLVDRVSDDVKGNLFGIAPGAKRGMMVAVSVLFVMQMVTIAGHQREQRKWESAHAVEFAAARESRATIDRLASADPVAAHCFATDYYEVDDDAAQRFHAPQAMLVEAYANGYLGKTWDVELERFLGYRVSSLRALDAAKPVARDGALTEYVKTRKLVVGLAHRTYGEAGLSTAQAAYDTPQDRLILAALRERRQSGAIGGVSDAALGRDIDLLISAPDAFIPCPAREASSRTRSAS